MSWILRGDSPFGCSFVKIYTYIYIYIYMYTDQSRLWIADRRSARFLRQPIDRSTDRPTDRPVNDLFVYFLVCLAACLNIYQPTCLTTPVPGSVFIFINIYMPFVWIAFFLIFVCSYDVSLTLCLLVAQCRFLLPLPWLVAQAGVVFL